MGAGSITLRSTTGRDFAAVDALLRRAYPKLLKADYPPSVMVTAVPLFARANSSLLQSGSYYVAETPEGEIIGAGGWTPVRGSDGTAEVRHLVVDWRRQRLGVGRRLMLGIFAEAQAQGMARFEAQATRTAVPFYAAMGFDSLGKVVVTLRPGIDFPVVAMRRHL